MYVDKLASTAPESGDLAFGSALHSAINGVLTGQNGEELFEIYWNSYQDKEIVYGRFKWAELKELGLKFLSKFSRLHSGKYSVSRAEQRLYGEYRGVKFEGTPDFLGLYGGKPSLRDFKTSGYNYPKEKEDTALQLYLYAYLAVSAADFYPETLGYDVFNKGTGSIQTMTWDYDKYTMFKYLDDMVDYCEMIDKQTHYAKNPNACVMGSIKCSMFDQCWGKKK